jgi:hypothetical protein
MQRQHQQQHGHAADGAAGGASGGSSAASTPGKHPRLHTGHGHSASLELLPKALLSPSTPAGRGLSGGGFGSAGNSSESLDDAVAAAAEGYRRANVGDGSGSREGNAALAAADAAAAASRSARAAEEDADDALRSAGGGLGLSFEAEA